jgi:hypothetical protein
MCPAVGRFRPGTGPFNRRGGGRPSRNRRSGGAFFRKQEIRRSGGAFFKLQEIRRSGGAFFKLQEIRRSGGSFFKLQEVRRSGEWESSLLRVLSAPAAGTCPLARAAPHVE